jgi:hypothetical protein
MKYSIANKYLLMVLTLFFVLFFTNTAFSVVPGDEAMGKLLQDISDKAFKEWMPRVAKYTIWLLTVTTTIAFAIGCKDLALSGGIQLEGIVSLFVRYAFLSGIIYWLLQLPGRLFIIPLSLEMLGGYLATGTPVSVLSMSGMSDAFDNILGPLYAYYQTLDYWSIDLCIICCVLVFFINCLYVLFLTTIVLVKIECFFIFIGGMVTAAFFVLGYFRDIFMGYIKALVMVGFKYLLLSLCYGLMKDTIYDWGNKLLDATLSGMDPNIIYNMVIPISFGLLAFYIVLKAVPQYAVAILTGHATADGSMAKVAVMAGAGAALNVWKTTHGMSQTAINAANATNSAAQAYKNTSSSVLNSGGSKSKAVSMGSLSAIKTFMTAPIFGKADDNNKNIRVIRNAVNNNSSINNDIKPGGSNDAFKAKASYDENMKK